MRREEILNKIEQLKEAYLPQWKPSLDDPGWAVSKVFANFLGELEEQREKLPQKLFIAYLDSLGFTQNPPLAAKTPITFLLTKNYKGSVLIPKGTLIATKSKVNFETIEAMVASSAKLVSLVDYHYSGNKTYINDHTELFVSNNSIELFSENNEVIHYIYFGDDHLFDIHKRANTSVGLTFTVPENISSEWEYFGKKCKDSKAGWCSFLYSGNTLDKTSYYATVKKKINGVESYWIRAKVAKKSNILDTYTINFKSRSSIDALFHNDTPIDLDSTINPFGLIPQVNDSFYIASREGFSKKGFQIKVNTNLNDTLLSWEYWNGKSWKPLGGHEFKCPEDITLTKVNGEENYWVRVRLLNNTSYVKYQCDVNPKIIASNVPTIKRITIDVNQSDKYVYLNKDGISPKHIYEVGENEFREEKSLYFGFDKCFETGLFSMYIQTIEENSSDKKNLKWQYFSIENNWKNLDVKDETNGFTKSGYCQFIAPSDQGVTEKFSRSAYWIKVLFDDTEEKSLKGIYLNSIEARESKSIKNMLLGSSDGSGSQTFIFNETPVFDLKLWVLEASLPDTYAGYEDKLGDGYWVQWLQVERLDHASGDERIYTFNSSLGEITFGDDKKGKIPISGKDNIVVSYRIGGGKKGNVSAEKITKLVDSLAFVDKVNNPIDASGGADIQGIEELIEMAPKRIKHRYRAVAREDYGYLAREASSDVARVSIILPKSDEVLGGVVALYIIPFAKQDRPQPSLKLIKVVQDYMDQVVPATVQVEVKEPSYITLSLNITLTLIDWEFASGMKGSINRALKQFLHPLEGNHQGQGWAFGILPSLANFYQLLDEIEGIEIVETLQVTLSDSKGNYALNDQTMPILSKRELICNGVHRFELKSGGV